MISPKDVAFSANFNGFSVREAIKDIAELLNNSNWTKENTFFSVQGQPSLILSIVHTLTHEESMYVCQELAKAGWRATIHSPQSFLITTGARV